MLKDFIKLYSEINGMEDRDCFKEWSNFEYHERSF